MKGALPWVVVVLVGALPWLAGLHFPFLYDDLGMIVENSFLEDSANLGRVLTGRTLGDPQVVNGRRPAVLATYFFDRALWGMRPAGWRITSLLWHLGNVALWMALLRRKGRGLYCSAAAGLIFALHPLLVEAVHAPGFRADVVCCFFMLAALNLLGGSRWRPLTLIAGFFFQILALLAKETALIFPLVLGLWLGWYPADDRPIRWRVWGGSVVVAALFFALWLALPGELQAAGAATGLEEILRFPWNLWSAPALWTRTLRMLLVPWPLNVTPFFEPVRSLGDPRLVLGLFWLLVSGWGVWRLRTAAPDIAAGWAWIFLFFVPVSNLWPLFHPVADRYFYPMVPGFALVAAGILARQSRFGRRIGLVTLAMVYAGLLLLRLSQWETAEKLWSNAYVQNPRSARAAIWLGLLREEAGDAEGARAFYRAALEANPQAAAAWINWGILEGRQGNLAEAERLLRRAVELQPDRARAWHNLAVCLERQGRSAEAAAAAEAAARAGNNPAAP